MISQSSAEMFVSVYTSNTFTLTHAAYCRQFEVTLKSVLKAKELKAKQATRNKQPEFSVAHAVNRTTDIL